MDIETLKEPLGDERFATLKAFVDGLEGKLSTLRKKADTETASAAKLRDAQARLLEKLGVESLDEIDALPDAKGQADAVKQFEVKLRKMEKDLTAAVAARDDAVRQHQSSLQKAALAEAMSGHDFVARDLVEAFVSPKLAWEGDTLSYQAEDGQMVSIKDGLAGLVKARPELLKPAGTGGAGVRQPAAGGSGTQNPWSKETFNLTEQFKLESQDPKLAASLKAQATPQ